MLRWIEDRESWLGSWLFISNEEKNILPMCSEFSVLL